MIEGYQIALNYGQDRDSVEEVLDERITDLHFARWGQADDLLSEICTTEFQGQFDIVSRERKRLQAEFRQNEVEVKFRNKSKDDDNIDEIMQGKYRTDRRLSKSKQCFQIAQDDAIDCGYGAWRLVTEEEDDQNTLSTNLEVRREAIPEAIRKVFWDCNSVLYDKSDATRCSVIHDFDELAYKRFLEENDIDEEDVSFVSFDSPYESIYELYFNRPFRYPFFNNGNKKINILEYYQLEPVKTTYYQYMDVATGQPFIITKESAKEQGLGEPMNKRTKTEKQCFKYLFNGVEILKRTKVPGGMIPIVPAYGERNFVNGTENFYGIVKTLKDPQTLINSAFNYLASMMMFSPVPKPVFDPREIEGHEHLWENANNQTYAYQLKNKLYVDESGNQIPFAQENTQPPQIPPAVANIIGAMPQMMDLLSNPGITNEAAETSISGVALQQIREEIGIMSYIYLDNWAESMRRDGEIYAAMAAEVYDVERTVIVTNADGTTTEEVINAAQFIPTMDMFGQIEFQTVQVNKVYDERFDVHFDIGPSYKSQRDATLNNLKDMYISMDPADPVRLVIMLYFVSKQQGEGNNKLKLISNLTRL